MVANVLDLSRTLDGRDTFPLLIEHLDPALVGIQFQMSSMPTTGSAVTYFTLYPGRFWSARLQGVNAGDGVRAFPPLTLPDENLPVPGPPGGGRGRGALPPYDGTAGDGRGGGAAGRGNAGLALGDDTIDGRACSPPPGPAA